MPDSTGSSTSPLVVEEKKGATVQPLVTLDVADRIATVTLNSVRNRNALSRQLVSELSECLRAADENSEVRGILLRSSDRVFCSGADLTEASTTSMLDASRKTIALQRQIVAASTPVVVRLDGPVRAGGLGLVGAADIVVASTDVTFALTEARLALAPAIISLTLLPRMTSRAAADVFLTGRTFSAEEAVGMGLVTVAVPSAQVSDAVSAILDDVRRAHPQGLKATKAVINRDILSALDARGDELARTSAELFESEPARARIAALMRK